MPYKTLVIILLNIIVYWRTIGYGYVSDDLQPSKRPGKIKKDRYKYKDKKWHKVHNIWHKLWLEFTGIAYFNPKRAHAMTLALHIITCLLIYYALGANQISFLASILFSLNPSNTQGGSIWLSGRIYGVSTLLAIGMFAFPLASPLLYYATKFFSINALFAPLVFIGTKYWYLVALPLIGIIIHKQILDTKRFVGTNIEMRSFHLRKLIPFIKSYGYYFVLCLCPFRIALYHTFLWGVGVNKMYNRQAYKLDWTFWGGLSAFSMVGWIIYTLWGQPVSLGLLWFTVNISMWCNAITYQQQISERCVHTANVGLMYALAATVIDYPVAITFFITFYLVRLWFVIPMYKNEYWHTEYSMIEGKNCNYIWIARGMKKFSMGDYLGAFFDFMEAKRCIPWEFKANYNAANMAIITQKFKEAEKLLMDAERCPYEDQEEAMIGKVRRARAWLEDIHKTKNIDLSRVEVVR